MGSTQQHVYASYLRQNLGYPLRNPQPNDTLGQPYSKEGLQIGDVGYVDDYGEFILVFNIQFPPKELHHQCLIQFAEPVAKRAFDSNKILLGGVRRNLKDSRADYAFTTTSREGAILILPDGAALSELQGEQQLEGFRELATKYALHWCKFAKQRSLYLVTAVYKSRSWTLGAFYDGTPGEEIHVHRRSHDSSGTLEYDWEYQYNVDHQQSPRNNRYLNQSVLIKGFKMTVRWDVLPVVERAERTEGLFARLFSTLWLTMISWWWLSRINIKYVPAMNLSQPHHPLDIINRVLLDQNPEARVAVTHDSDWIEMLERGLPLADLKKEDCLRTFIVSEHNWNLDCSQSAVYLQKNSKGRNGKHDPAHNIKNTFSHALPPSDNPRLTILNMRLENIENDRICAGVCVLIQFENTTRRTMNSPYAEVIEWNDEVVLPPDQPIYVTVCAVFQRGSTLGTREISAKHIINTNEASGGVHMIRFPVGNESRSSLLITLGRQFSHVEPRSTREENSPFVEHTTDGFKALYSYYEEEVPNQKHLEDALERFRRALEQCNLDSTYRATALFNLATAELIMHQTRGTYSELTAPIEYYEEALRLRSSGHPDRRATMLLLAQALLSHHVSDEHNESVIIRIMHLLKEIPPDDSRERKTADTIIRTCRFYTTLGCRDLSELDKLSRDLNRGVYVPPYGFTDRPHMLHRLGVAFLARSQRNSKLDDLDKSDALNNEALHLIPDEHHDQADIAACLGISSFLRRIKAGGDLTDLDMDEALADATKLKIPKFDVYHTLCDILEVGDRVTEAVSRFLQIESELVEDTIFRREREMWGLDFRRRCREKLEKLANDAMDTRKYDVAEQHLSTILLLKPIDRMDILVKRSSARILLELWDEALSDADEVIELIPSSHRGYEVRHAALHGAERYAEAVKSFDMILSTLEGSADPNIRRLRLHYVDARPTIGRTVGDTIRFMPRVLIDSCTGHLYDKQQQSMAFDTLPIYYELVSSMIRKLDEARIRTAVEEFFRYVMLSHVWEYGESILRKVGDISIYDLEPSPMNIKIQNFCSLVRSLGFRWAWSDTCCIDKSQLTILQESLVAMFSWYRGASLTIVHLSGVSSQHQIPGDLRKSVWNTRGWTYPEYVAAETILFYTEDWKPYLGLTLPNHKESSDIIMEMEEATGLSAERMSALQPGLDMVREKLYLASARHTTVEEDAAYSLLGMFNLSIPILYGEGNRSVGRLLENLLTATGDVTVLAWTGTSGNYNSCLPMDLTPYNHTVPPHIPRQIEKDEMDNIIAGLRSSMPDLSIVMTLHNRITNLLPLPLFVASRLKLSGIISPITELVQTSESLPRSSVVLHGYRATTSIFGDVEIVTIQDLTRMRNLCLVHPWIQSLFNQEQEPTLDEEMHALRLVARLKLPFGAFMFASYPSIMYGRVAADSLIMARVSDEVSLNDLIKCVGTIDVM